MNAVSGLAQKDTSESKRAEFAEEKRQHRAVTMVDAMIMAGKILPNERQGMITFVAGIDEKDVIQFGERKSDLKTPTEFFEGFLSALPVRFH